MTHSRNTGQRPTAGGREAPAREGGRALAGPQASRLELTRNLR